MSNGPKWSTAEDAILGMHERPIHAFEALQANGFNRPYSSVKKRRWRLLHPKPPRPPKPPLPPGFKADRSHYLRQEVGIDYVGCDQKFRAAMLAAAETGTGTERDMLRAFFACTREQNDGCRLDRSAHRDFDDELG